MLLHCVCVCFFHLSSHVPTDFVCLLLLLLLCRYCYDFILFECVRSIWFSLVRLIAHIFFTRSLLFHSMCLDACFVYCIVNYML